MNKSKISKCIDIFQNIEVVIAILAILVYIVPRLFGWTPYVVTTGSMEPSIPVGSVAFIAKPNSISDIKVDDVIGFTLDTQTMVLHRVAEVHDEYFITKGDANDTADEKYIYHKDIIGKKMLSIPYVGKFTTALSGTKAKVIVGIIIAVNIALSIVAYMLKKDKKEEIKETGEKENN